MKIRQLKTDPGEQRRNEAAVSQALDNRAMIEFVAIMSGVEIPESEGGNDAEN